MDNVVLMTVLHCVHENEKQIPGIALRILLLMDLEEVQHQNDVHDSIVSHAYHTIKEITPTD